MGRARVVLTLVAGGVAVLVPGPRAGALPPAHSQEQCAGPALSIAMAEEGVLQIGFTGLGADQLREVRLHTTPDAGAVPQPDEGVIWQVRSSSALGISPVVVKVPEAPAGMTVPVALEEPLPDQVTVVAQLLDADRRPVNLTQPIDVAGLRGGPPGTAELDVGCGEDPGDELGSIVKSIAIGAGLFIAGVSVLLLIVNMLLLGLRRAIFGAANH